MLDVPYMVVPSRRINGSNLFDRTLFDQSETP